MFQNPVGNPADPTYWTSSSVYDGTPFRDDPRVIDTTEDSHINDNVIVVYPNPTKDNLFLKAEYADSTIQIEIYSLSGLLIYKSTIVGNSVIGLGRLNINSGIYLVKTKCNENITVHKVIYQK